MIMNPNRHLVYGTRCKHKSSQVLYTSWVGISLPRGGSNPSLGFQAIPNEEIILQSHQDNLGKNTRKKPKAIQPINNLGKCSEKTSWWWTRSSSTLLSPSPLLFPCLLQTDGQTQANSGFQLLLKYTKRKSIEYQVEEQQDSKKVSITPEQQTSPHMAASRSHNKPFSHH